MNCSFLSWHAARVRAELFVDWQMTSHAFEGHVQSSAAQGKWRDIRETYERGGSISNVLLSLLTQQLAKNVAPHC
jgi:hypothetical protein